MKPENVLMHERKEVKICDMGLSSVKFSIQEAQKTSTEGTIMYMAPKQALKTIKATFACDIWSTAALLGELCAEKDFGTWTRTLSPAFTFQNE